LPKFHWLKFHPYRTASCNRTASEQRHRPDTDHPYPPRLRDDSEIVRFGPAGAQSLSGRRLTATATGPRQIEYINNSRVFMVKLRLPGHPPPLIAGLPDRPPCGC
jgi:hypothetical protein